MMIKTLVYGPYFNVPIQRLVWLSLSQLCGELKGLENSGETKNTINRQTLSQANTCRVGKVKQETKGEASWKKQKRFQCHPADAL